MSIAFLCAKCRMAYRVDDTLAGQPTRCRQCGADMVIPDLAGPGSPKLVDVQAPPGSNIDWNAVEGFEKGVQVKPRKVRRGIMRWLAPQRPI